MVFSSLLDDITMSLRGDCQRARRVHVLLVAATNLGFLPRRRTLLSMGAGGVFQILPTMESKCASARALQEASWCPIDDQLVTNW